MGDILWFRSYLSNLGWSQPPSTILFQDNLSCMDIANNLDTNERTKHIDIKHHFIKDHINKGTLKMEYLPTTEMTADILTKALPAFLFPATSTPDYLSKTHFSFSTTQINLILLIISQ